MQRQLIMEVVDIAGNGDVTLRDYGGKEINEWAAPAILTLSNPDETYAIGALLQIDISDPL